MTGLVVIATGELGRYTSFTRSLGSLRVPDGAGIEWVTAANPAAGRNQALRRHPDAAWVWFMDDDHVFAPDTLLRLLAHDVPVVVPICARRSPPLSPVLYRADDLVAGQFPSMEWYDLPRQGGLLKVDAVGGAGLLVQRDVLDALGDPWFELGQTKSDELGEDLHFSRKVRAAGFPLHVDLDTPIGHTAPMTVWPVNGPAGWGVDVDLGAGVRVRLGAPQPEAVPA